ncbi:MAG: S-methyl-5-thioribose-1-phosphate isomerase [Candidatus Omnitrophota bacterium]|nr:S-methyl-5-thioribose-1-phosphate isomerase [Candidatus Omnitrophota bacterium]
MKESPLFWPVRFKDNTIYILDESLLPHKATYIKVKDYKGACWAIKEMKTLAVGQVLLVLYTFLLVIKKNKLKSNLLHILENVAKNINDTRPTISLKSLTDMVLVWAKTPACLENNILGFLASLKNKRIAQAKEASALIKDNDVILTYCNVSGLMPLMGNFCRLQKKEISFYVAETRPYLQGSRLTAWELKKQGFDVTIIADNMVAKVLSEGKINKVIVGADHLAQNGDIANKIGTYQIAILAKYFRIPFYVLCPPKASTKTGKDIKIEIRPEKELLEYSGIRIAPKGVKAYYPAFDITPNELITKHIYLKV